MGLSSNNRQSRARAREVFYFLFICYFIFYFIFFFLHVVRARGYSRVVLLSTRANIKRVTVLCVVFVIHMPTHITRAYDVFLVISRSFRICCYLFIFFLSTETRHVVSKEVQNVKSNTKVEVDNSNVQQLRVEYCTECTGKIENKNLRYKNAKYTVSRRV